MALVTLTSSQVLLGEIDLSPVTGSVETGWTRDMRAADVISGGGFSRVVPGLLSVETTVSGFADFDAGQVSAMLTSASAAGNQKALSIVPVHTAATGDTAFLTRGRVQGFPFTAGGVGDVATVSTTLAGDTTLISGVVAKPLSAVTTSGNASGVQLGALTASQTLYAACHFTAVSGSPSVTVKIQSDDSSAFTTPTDRITFTAQTGVGWQFSTVAGAVTDTWWRAQWTVSGTSPSMTFAVTFGIQ